MSSYNNKLDADAQITMEEGIAAIIFGRSAGRKMTEDLATKLSKLILLSVFQNFRPDFMKDSTTLKETL